MTERDSGSMVAVDSSDDASDGLPSLSHSETTGAVSTVGTGVGGWLGARIDRLMARFAEFGAGRGRSSGDEKDTAALTRTGGPVARWISFPRGVRSVTAVTSGIALGLGAWGLVVFAGYSFAPGAVAIAAGVGLAALSGPIGVRLANRLHRLIARHRRCRISELRGLPDRRAVAVRGVVLATRTAASTLDARPVVWSLTRFRLGRPPVVRAFFHEVAFDFLIADGTDEPIWVEPSGGMLIDRFAADRRVQFQNTTLLDIDHPFLTGLRLRDRKSAPRRSRSRRATSSRSWGGCRGASTRQRHRIRGGSRRNVGHCALGRAFR